MSRHGTSKRGSSLASSELGRRLGFYLDTVYRQLANDRRRPARSAAAPFATPPPASASLQEREPFETEVESVSVSLPAASIAPEPALVEAIAPVAPDQDANIAVAVLREEVTRLWHQLEVAENERVELRRLLGESLTLMSALPHEDNPPATAPRPIPQGANHTLAAMVQEVRPSRELIEPAEPIDPLEALLRRNQHNDASANTLPAPDRVPVGFVEHLVISPMASLRKALQDNHEISPDAAATEPDPQSNSDDRRFG